MPNPSSFKAQWQEILAEVAEEFKANHIDVYKAVDQLSHRMDEFVTTLIEHAIKQLPGSTRDTICQDIAIIAVGGYGRGEMFPYSDVDLLITYEGTLGPLAAQFNSEFVRLCWDSGIKLGQATRSIKDTIVISREESQVATGLVQTRLIWGSEELHSTLRKRFENSLDKFRRGFIDRCQESRKQEISETALAVFSLEPNVKCSPGTLRDLQLIQWVGYARHGVTSLDDLVECGALRPEVVESLKKAHYFFSDIRMKLHLASSRAQDILTRDEQLRLSDQEGITDFEGQRAVERYMQQYFRHADFVARTARRFIEMSRPTSFQERVSARVCRRIIQERYIVLNGRLNVISPQIPEVLSSLESILEVFNVAADNKVRLGSRLIELIRSQAVTFPKQISPKSVELFLRLLDQIGHVGEIVRELEECGILEILVPQFTHARGLLQFNNYHAYTVDEHTFRALEAMDSLWKDHTKHSIFTELNKPWILSLSLLLHDLGKGFEQDHSILGAQIAHQVGHRFGLEEEDENLVALLIREHLSMSILAFRRDTTDPEVVNQFAGKLGSELALHLLYLLTISDITAVGPGIWTDWKSQLLEELYQRTLLSYVGKYDRPTVDKQIEDTRQRVIDQFKSVNSNPADHERIAAELDSMPDHYLQSIPAQNIVEDMQAALRLNDYQVEIIDRFDKETQTLELTIMTRQPIVQRLFHRISGVLTASHLSILTADIYSSSSGFVCDRFQVQDIDDPSPLDETRLKRIRDQLSHAVSGPISFQNLFQKQKRIRIGKKETQISNQRHRVSIDNKTSPQATIIDVFAHDRAGLLFTISKAISDLELSVTLARITTHVDQVVDVFYVTDSDQQKITNPDQLKGVVVRLEHALAEFERHGHKLFIS